MIAPNLPDERLALELFRSLLELDDPSDAMIEARLSESDTSIAARVRAMLARHRSSTDRLERPWHEAVRSTLPPLRLGAFSVGQEIGRGGMGVVALGERTEEGFTQRVAIKWIADAQVDSSRRNRFLFERDVVVRLQHPHIAQLIDGGAGPCGELWYAMEFVDGKDLPTHCRDHRLPLRARVGLLADLCDAVSHAHRNSILHRDIKPGNVLVTPDGQLKLIDFGIAKSLDAGSGHETLDAMPMTPKYASPEQLRGERPTTASDQWQVAALAFEVLSGRRLRDGAPPWRTMPSQRVAESLEAIAAEFQTDVTTLAKSLRGDLDAIISKALNDIPERRYGSVDEMARELRDWLAGRPLASRRAERWYTARRYIATHRWALGSAALALLALVTVAVVSVVLGNRAQEEARIANRTADLVSDMFLSRMDGRNLHSMTMADLFTHLVDTAAADTELPEIRRYRILRDLAPRAAEIGAGAAAERATRAVLEMSKSIYGAESLETARNHATLATLAMQVRGQAAIEFVKPHLASSEAIYAMLDLQNHSEYFSHLRARSRFEFLSGDNKAMLASTQKMLELAEGDASMPSTFRLQARVLVSGAYDAAGDKARAALELDHAVEDARAAAKAEPHLAAQVDWLDAMACEQHSRASPEIAVQRCADLVTRFERDGKIDTKNGHEALLGLCTAQGKLGRNEAALATCLRAERVLRVVEGDDTQSSSMGTTQRRIGTRSFAVGRYQEGVIAQKRALNIVESIQGPAHANTLGVRLELAESLHAAGRDDEVLLTLPAVTDVSVLPEEKRRRWAELRAAAQRNGR